MKRVLHIRSESTSVSPDLQYLTAKAQQFQLPLEFSEVLPAKTGFDSFDFSGYDAVLFTSTNGTRDQNGELIYKALRQGLVVAVVGSPLRQENYPGHEPLGELHPGVIDHSFPSLEIAVSGHPVLAGVTSVTSAYAIRVNCPAVSRNSNAVVLKWHDNGNPAVAVSRRWSGILGEFSFYIGESLSEDGTRAVLNTLNLQRI